MENPIKNGWFGGTIIFGNIHFGTSNFEANPLDFWLELVLFTGDHLSGDASPIFGDTRAARKAGGLNRTKSKDGDWNKGWYIYIYTR